MNIPISTNEVIIYAIVTVVIFLILWIVRLEIKIRNIPSVKNNRNINNQIGSLEKEIHKLKEFEEKSLSDVNSIKSDLKKTIKGITTVRFNPFTDGSVGGNQSFATSIVDDEGNGVIISSLYSRERVSIFAKPILNWNSEYELSAEERKALDESKQIK